MGQAAVRQSLKIAEPDATLSNNVLQGKLENEEDPIGILMRTGISLPDECKRLSSYVMETTLPPPEPLKDVRRRKPVSVKFGPTPNASPISGSCFSALTIKELARTLRAPRGSNKTPEGSCSRTGCSMRSTSTPGTSLHSVPEDYIFCDNGCCRAYRPEGMESVTDRIIHKIREEKSIRQKEVDTFLKLNGFKGINEKKVRKFGFWYSYPLHCAISKGDVEMVNSLLLLGADPRLPDADGFTPYDRILAQGQGCMQKFERVKTTLKHGAKQYQATLHRKRWS
jgi:hypothetical protein